VLPTRLAGACALALAVPCCLTAQNAPAARAAGSAQGHHVAAEGSSKAVRAMSKDAMIRNALSAAPKAIAKDATVMGPGPDGKMTELRAGSNGFTCFPDNPSTPGQDPMCADEQSMKWAQSLMNHDEKPANTAPGIAYMLRGGSDISATDPFATTSDHYVSSPPHWMILWPADAKTSGLATTPKKTGTWIMWAGTPYAHLMINQVP
jgi:hypothetical protein